MIEFLFFEPELRLHHYGYNANPDYFVSFCNQHNYPKCDIQPL